MTIELRNYFPQRMVSDPEWPAGTTWAAGTFKVVTAEDGVVHGRSPQTGDYIRRSGLRLPASQQTIDAMAVLGFSLIAVSVEPAAATIEVSKLAFQTALAMLEAAEPVSGLADGPQKTVLLALAAAHENCFDMFDALATDVTVLGMTTDAARLARIQWESATTILETDPTISLFGDAVGFDTVQKRHALFALAKAISVGDPAAEELATLRTLLAA